MKAEELALSRRPVSPEFDGGGSAARTDGGFLPRVVCGVVADNPKGIESFSPALERLVAVRKHLTAVWSSNSRRRRRTIPPILR
jgi:hypothetical protein